MKLNYSAEEFHIGCRTFSLEKGINGLCVVTFNALKSDFGEEESLKFKCPRFFVRNDWQCILRVNFYTYCKVSVPLRLKKSLRRCDSVEIITGGGAAEDAEGHQSLVPVSRVLRFPEVYELALLREERRKKQSKYTDMKNNQFRRIVQETIEMCEKWQEYKKGKGASGDASEDTSCESAE